MSKECVNRKMTFSELSQFIGNFVFHPKKMFLGAAFIAFYEYRDGYQGS